MSPNIQDISTKTTALFSSSYAPPGTPQFMCLSALLTEWDYLTKLFIFQLSHSASSIVKQANLYDYNDKEVEFGSLLEDSIWLI